MPIPKDRMRGTIEISALHRPSVTTIKFFQNWTYVPYFLLAGMLRTRSVHLTGHKRGETLQKRDRSGAKIGLNFCLTPLPTNALIVVCGLFGIGCLDSFK